MKLIINAEDFGLSESVNKGILEGLLEGFITSASLIMNAEYCDEALGMIKKNKLTNVGVHLNLTYGYPLTKKEKVKSLVEEDGKFRYMCSMPFFAKYKDAKTELKAQIEKFYKSGLTPSHLDFHHYFYSAPEVYKAYLDLAKEYKLPIRSMTQRTQQLAKQKNLKTPDYFVSDFHESYNKYETLKNICESLKGLDGVCELMTTPGYIDTFTSHETNYLAREDELIALKGAKENGLFKGLKLTSFKNAFK